MKVAIIGAGVAGLASARRAVQYNLECTVFEATGHVGGTWVYTENPYTDEFNNPVRSSLYASVRTNVPTQLMELEGLEFKPSSGLSYPHHEELLEYYQNFAEKYHLRQYIKFYHEVLKISREENLWKLIVTDLKRNTFTIYTFDAIVLCTGKYSKPKLPEINGMETFHGDQIHSHYYRRKDPYKDKRLLIVGTGFSGVEISMECSEIAHKVYLSYHTDPPKNYEENIEIKGPISSIDGCKIHFEDDTYIYVDSIIYCTGYEYDTSLLHPSCGIEMLEGKIFKPLYKMFINAAQPTMAILGLLRKSIMTKLDDLQAELFMKHLSGRIHLPSTEEMLQSFLDDHSHRSNRGTKYYDMNLATEEYCNDLAQIGNITPLPLVIWRMWIHDLNYKRTHWKTFRNQSIRKIDDENFEFEEIDEERMKKE